MSVEQYSYLAMLMDEQPQANVLVWGLGGDSGLWMNANRRGRTVFLENLVPWIDAVKHRIPSTCGWARRSRPTSHPPTAPNNAPYNAPLMWVLPPSSPGSRGRRMGVQASRCTP
jgi:hypothetical protein